MSRGFALALLIVIPIAASTGYLHGIGFPERAVPGTAAGISLSSAVGEAQPGPQAVFAPGTFDYDLLSRKSPGKDWSGAGVPPAAEPSGLSLLQNS